MSKVRRSIAQCRPRITDAKTPLAEPRAGYFSNDDKIETPPETFSVGDSASKEEV